MNSYKKRKNKNQSWKIAASGFIGITGIIIIVSWLIRGIQTSQWDGQSQFGLVNQNNDIIVKLIILNQKKLIKFIIPDNTMVKVGFGFGEYRLNKVYELGKLEKQPGKVLTRTTQELLGIGIKGWQVNNKSNLSWWDKLRLTWFTTFNVDQTVTVNLGNNPAWQSESLNDGTLIYRVNQLWLDRLVHKEVFDQDISKEQLSVAILNASGVDGVADSVSRLISNFGAEVRLVTNLAGQDKSEIVISNKNQKETKTVKQIINSLGINSVRVDDIFVYRSDVVVIIGQDYTNL